MHTTRPDPDRQYRSRIEDSPIGPPMIPGASGLAPSPNVSNSRSRQSYGNHLPQRSDSSVSSNYSERPGSYTSPSSSGTRASTTRSSPALGTPLGFSDRSLDYRDQRSLPPIGSYGLGPTSESQRLASSQLSDPRYGVTPPPQMLSGQMYSGMSSGYGVGGYDRHPFSSVPTGGGYPLAFDNLSDYGDSKQKRRRGNLPKQVTDILRTWFTEHIAHPYPTEEEKVGLMQVTGLSMSQVGLCFPFLSRSACFSRNLTSGHYRSAIGLSTRGGAICPP